MGFGGFGALHGVRSAGKITVVNISQRISAPGSAHRGILLPLAAILAAALAAGFVALQSRPSVVLAKRQASLFDGIERRSPPRIRRLVAERYSDRWEFDRDDLVLTMVDAGSQFLALVVTPEEQRTEIDGRTATVSARLVVGGNPVGPVGNEVLRQVNRLDEPFVFTWEKESFLPSSWRLVKVDNAALPDGLYGYEPGDIRRAMRGE